MKPLGDVEREERDDHRADAVHEGGARQNPDWSGKSEHRLPVLEVRIEHQRRISKEAKAEFSSSPLAFTSTSVTFASAGPRWHHFSSASTCPGAPSAQISTCESGRLRTQPLRPSRLASSWVA